MLSSDITHPWAEGGIAALRLVMGVLVAWLHGWHTVVDGWHYMVTPGSEWPLLHDTVQMGFPAPVIFTALAALTQFAGGWLLALGAFTRLAALAIAATMLTALFFNLKTGGPDIQLAGLYALVIGAFVLVGGGRWSVDRLIEERSHDVLNLTVPV